MKAFIDRNSPLSFQTNTVVVQPINEWQFEVKINGMTVGHIVTRSNDWSIIVKGYPFTKNDENILMDAAKLITVNKKFEQ